MRILGVDPGSRLTGYGCIEIVGNQLRHVCHGTLNLMDREDGEVAPLERRLFILHRKLASIIREYSPSVLVVEKVFFAKNAVSALKLGHARGVIVLSGAIHSLDVVEYNPTEVKRAIVGHGRADKIQVGRMVEILIGKQEFKTADASDALALAICHAHIYLAARTPAANMRLKETIAAKRPRSRRTSLAESLGLSGKRGAKARTR